ncbi:MAG: purine-nucleoside phosphorylase [Bacteroidetes bacterium]|nr:purine-nucleoside phosphorylase [Bacteroidota bacterium]
MMNQLKETAAFLEAKGVNDPVFGIILGTGLGDVLNHISIIKTFDYSEIPHFPVSTVEFHKGKLVYGELNGIKLLVMQGRFHLYEGYSMQQITYPVRVMKLLGIQFLLMSNAAGGINKTFKKGDLVLIDDHINLQNGSPLTGPNIDELGPRFPDMSYPYSRELNQLLIKAASELNTTLKEGVYASVTGPNLETRAEYRYLHRIGADMVGMSTVPEVIVANHMSLPCAAVSVITDECDPDNLKPIDITEIIEVAGKADKKLAHLFLNMIADITRRSMNAI